MSDWNTLEGFEAWSTELKKLVEQAKNLNSGDDAASDALIAKLNKFVDCSRPNSEGILELDEIASDLAMDLTFSNIEEIANSVASRDQQISLLTKRLGLEAERNNQSAASIRFEKATELVESLTVSVNKVHGLLGTLEGLPEAAKKKLATRLNKLVKEAQAVRGEVEAMAGKIQP